MRLTYEYGKPVFVDRINGVNITICFSEKPPSVVKDNILEILTSCYEQRVQNVLGANDITN